MKINVTENKVSIKEEQILNENEYNIHKIQFDFSSEYTDDLVKVALFSIDNHTYKKIISNNECDIPPEVLTQRGYSILGVYAYKTEQDTLVLRYSPSPTRISVYNGSYKADAENSEPITPSEIEQYQQILQNSLQQFQNQYNALVEETEGDIQAIEDELQRKVDEGYFDGEDGYTPQKGTDYFTEQDIEEIEGDILNEVYTKSETDTLLEEKADIEDIPDVSSFITKDVNNLTNYTLKTNTGSLIDLEINDTTYVVTLKLKNQDGTVISTDTIDLPLESVVVSGRYDNTTKKVILTLENGSEVDFSVADLVAGLQTEITSSNKLASDLVDDTNSGNKFVTTTEKQTWNNKLDESDLTDYVKNTDYAQGNKGGVIKKGNYLNVNESGKVLAEVLDYNLYINTSNNVFIGKGTLENVITGKELINQTQLEESQETQDEEIEKLQTENARLKATLPTTTGEGQDVTLDKTAELEFKKPPLPRGNSEQFSTTGKNKFDGTYEKIYTFGSSPYKCASGNDIRSAVVKVNPNTTYTISKEASNRFRISQYAERPVVETTFATSYTQAGDSNTVYTLTTENTTQYLLIQVTNENQENVKMQVEEGSSATSYEPYTNGASPNPDYPQEITNVTGDVEVVVGNKNIFDLKKFLSERNVEYTENADGSLTFTPNSALYNTPLEFSREDTTISLSGIIINNTAINTRIQILNSEDTLVRQLNAGTSVLPNISGCKLRFNWSTLGTMTMKDIQIERSTTATTYTAHQEQVLPLTLGNIELCKIRDYQDYFYKENNKWYLHKEIGKVVFDGSENWLKSSNTNVDRFYLENSSFNMITRSSGYSNYFIIKTVSTEEVGVIYTNINQVVVNYSNYNITSLSDFMTWLSTHNLIFYYVLATPTDTEITDTALISQLEAIKQALSYEEQTNISSNTIALFSVEAYQDAKVILAEKGTYSKPSTGIPKTDLASDVQTSLNKADSAIQEHQDISGKQDITDNTLTTINKTVPTAINEVNSIAKLANQAKSYSTYQAFINYLNTAEKTEFIPGQSFMIQTKLIPDLWVYSVENTSVQYTYTTDEDFITYTNQATGGQVGYYKLAQLETQKVDLTNYVTFDDYATSTTAGVVKTNSMYGVSTSSYTQNITATTKTYDQYQSSNNATFVGKGTLENVITGKNLESANNKTTTISSSSTDNEYPSAKAVYDYIQSILNN